MKISENLQGCIHMFRGSFLVVFSVEFVLCLACDLSFAFPWLWSLVELLCFSFFLLSFYDFHFALCVVNALIKGEIEDQERPGGRWMTAPQ
jgi:hypothetical protein